MQTDLVTWRREWPDKSRLRFAYIFHYLVSIFLSFYVFHVIFFSVPRHKKPSNRLSTLCRSPCQNIVPLLSIGSHDDLSVLNNDRSRCILSYLRFLLCLLSVSLYCSRFPHKQARRISFISARVHPVESCSSFCMRGLINAAAAAASENCHQLLFVLVPMLYVCLLEHDPIALTL